MPHPHPENPKEAESELFRLLVENVRDYAIFVIDPDGRVQSWNHGAERLLGYREDEIIGQPADVFFTPEDIRAGVPQRELREAIGGGRGEDDRWHVRKDGTWFWSGGMTTPLWDEGRRLRGFTKIMRDRTEWKRQEDALRESEERHRLIAELTSDYSAVTQVGEDGTLTIESVSDGFHRITGYTLEELTARGGWPILVHPDDMPAVEESIKHWLANLPHTSEIRIITKSGETRWLAYLGRAVFDPQQGRVTRLLSAGQDVTERKRAEERVREQREWLRVTLTSIGDAVIATDTDGRVTFLNPVAEVLTGWPQGEAEGRPLEEIFPIFNEYTRRPVENPVAKVLREGQVIGLANHTALRARDGTERPIADSAAPIRSSSGELLGVVLVFRDVTEERRLEEELRRSEERYRRIAETAHDGIWLIDANAQTLFINRRMAEMLGCQPEDMAGRRVPEFCFEEDLPLARERIRANLQGRTEQFDFRFRRVDGTELLVLACTSAMTDADAQVVGALGMFSDVTERKRLEGAVRQRAERLAQVAGAALTIHSALSVESVLRVVTEEARRIVGTHQAVSSMSVNEQWAQAVNAVSLSDKYVRWRGYDVSPDGSGIYATVCRTNRPMRLTQAELEAHPAWKGFGKEAEYHPPMRGWLAVPLVGRDGRNLGLVQLSDKEDGGEFTAEDEAILTQLATIAAVAIENARLYDSLREADRRKDEFLATLAHELRNPLAPVSNAVQLLRLKEPAASVLEWATDVIGRQIRQMTRLIDDLMDVSRITRNKLQLRKEPVALAAVVRAAVETARPLVEQSGHELTVTLPSGEVTLDADPVRLAQVFSNLLTNAAKYTEPRGKIWLAAERRGQDVEVRVRDTGVGIPKEMLSRVFEMFTQVDWTLERSQGGLGIGLTLVRRLTEMHGGTVEAHSDGPGLGSEFVVRLPVAALPPDQREPVGEGATPASTVFRILVVDDNRDAADSLALVLQLLGHDLRTAHDGEEALRAAEEFRPDLVVLDIGLPLLNGYEVAQRIRCQPWGRAAILVALTGWGQPEDVRRSREAGFDHHFVKPVDHAGIERVLADLAARRGSRT